MYMLYQYLLLQYYHMNLLLPWPTLQQALSHPYFRPLPGFELDDVQAAYKALVQGAAEGA